MIPTCGSSYTWVMLKNQVFVRSTSNMRMFVIILALTTAEVFGQGQLKNGDSSGNGGKAGGSVGLGDAALDGNVEGTIDGGISVSVDAHEMCMNNCMCNCMAQSGISASGQAEIDADSQDGVSASGKASLNGPGYNCGSGPMPTTTAQLPTTTAQSGYKYMIDVKRDVTIAPSNKVVYTMPHTEPQQPITYKKRVDAESPFWITGWVRYNHGEDVINIPNSEAISACEESKNGNWEYFVLALMDRTLMPTGACPVEKGNYTMYRDQKIPVTFDEKINCGDYDAMLYVDTAEKEWAFQLTFDFTIPDDGTCTPQKSK